MSILYPIDKPVTPDDIRAKASDLLARTDEWTPWETVVLEMARSHAELVHGHYMRHVWYELEDLGEPDVQAARDDVLAGVEALLGAMRPEHAHEAPFRMGTGNDMHDVDGPEAIAALLVHAGIMIDDLVESLRRGPCAIDNNEMHGFDLTAWHEILQFHDADARTPSFDGTLDSIQAAIELAREDETSGGVEELRKIISRRIDRQNKRNEERVAATVAGANENYRLPDSFMLRLSRVTETYIHLEWGPNDHAPDGMEEIVTRPKGTETIQLQLSSLHEVHPVAIANIARAGRFAALSIGRDAEIRSTGSPLSEPPIWTWAGPLPLVRHVLQRLRAGQDVDVGKGGMTAGPLLSAKRIELGDGAAVYAYNARTLDESLTLAQQIPDTLVHACIGNPISVVVKAAMLDDPRVTVQACESEEGRTDFDLISPVVRLVKAPEGYEQDPEAAWMGMLAEFDEHAVYGERLYRQTAPGTEQ